MIDRCRRSFEHVLQDTWVEWPEDAAEGRLARSVPGARTRERVGRDGVRALPGQVQLAEASKTIKGIRSICVEDMQAVVALGRSMNLKVIAEGVETQAQQKSLTFLGFDEAQGFLLGRPGEAGAVVLESSGAAGSLASTGEYRQGVSDPGWFSVSGPGYRAACR